MEAGRTWIVGEGISIIQAEAADSKVDVGWPMKEPIPRRGTRDEVSRVEISIGVRKRQKISQGAPPAHCRPPKIYSNPLFSNAR